MPFASRFGLHVVVNGHVVKDLANGEVQIPFGTEYAVRLRNRHKERYAVVKLFIDGEEQSKGGFIIPPNSHRDIRNSSFSTKVFKFVDLDGQEALDAGKDQDNPEKQMGVIEARFHLQREEPKVQHVHHHHSYPVPQPYPVPVPTPYPWPRPWHPYRRDLTHYYDSACRRVGAGGSSATFGAVTSHDAASYSSGDIKTCGDMGGFNSASGLESMGCVGSAEAAPQAMLASLNVGQHVNSTKSAARGVRSREVRDGATVEGSNTGVNYGTQWVDIEDDYVPLKLFMRGYDTGVQAEIPVPPPGVAMETPKLPDAVPVATDSCHCDQCGAKSARKSSKFCHVCGAKLLC